VDTSLEGLIFIKIGIQFLWRPSMKKFEAPQFLGVEIAKTFDRPGKVTLNRPLIKILEDLGIPSNVFIDLQNDAISETTKSVQSIPKFAKILYSHGLGISFHFYNILRDIHFKLGLDSNDLLEGDFFKFLQSSFEFAVNHTLRELKYSCKIPIEEAYAFVGIADEFDYLKANQVYCCIYDPITKKKSYVKGPVCIYRSPCIHPGDVQVVHRVVPCLLV
jgi:RNA-dependent RNA polymerase